MSRSRRSFANRQRRSRAPPAADPRGELAGGAPRGHVARDAAPGGSAAAGSSSAVRFILPCFCSPTNIGKF